MKGTVLVHSRKLAIYLQCRGFFLLGVQPNLKNDLKVFLFHHSKEIEKAMVEYKKDIQFKQYLDGFKMAR